MCCAYLHRECRAKIKYTAVAMTTMNNNQMIIIFFLQSGTTGNPKGVMLSHDNVGQAI